MKHIPNSSDSATPEITDSIVANIEDASTLTLCSSYNAIRFT
jgi:hypothetical protein